MNDDAGTAPGDASVSGDGPAPEVVAPEVEAFLVDGGARQPMPSDIELPTRIPEATTENGGPPVGEPEGGAASARSTPTIRERRVAAFAAQAEAETTMVTRAAYVRQTRRSVLAGLGAMLGGGLGWTFIQRSVTDGNIPVPLRNGFEFTEAIWSTLYDPGRLAPEFALSDAEPIRVNGTIGLGEEIDLDAWHLRVEGPDGVMVDEVDLPTLLEGLPQVDQVTEHKCIEGWSNVVHWTGVRFADVAARYGDLAGLPYVSLATPDGEYYVGLDTDTAMHPQTLLVHSWNGERLTQNRGAPLRLATPLHYGIKSLKRVGTVRFSRERPADYWAERGYDWHSLH